MWAFKTKSSLTHCLIMGWRERSVGDKSVKKAGNRWIRFLQCWCARVCVHAVHGWTADSLLRNIWLWPLSLTEWDMWVQVCKILWTGVNMAQWVFKGSGHPNYKRKDIYLLTSGSVSCSSFICLFLLLLRLCLWDVCCHLSAVEKTGLLLVAH